MSLCLVSAFLDIGRENWSSFRRSTDQYFDNFLPYTKMSHDMIVFMDDKHIDRFTSLCKASPQIKIIPINRELMEKNIYAYQQLVKEREIMESKKFKDLISHRLMFPECSKPEYNIIQHSKIDFIAYVINNKQLNQAEYYAWTDFGYFQVPNRVPSKPLDLKKFDLDKINFQAMNDLNDKDRSILYTLMYAPERIGGFFYLGRADLLLKYQTLYHEICQDFHRMLILDDDQHVMMQCVFRRPELFKVWNLGAWHMSYKYFQQ